jgi:peptidoglycan/LPS O-acetylase OafA/YrhL
MKNNIANGLRGLAVLNVAVAHFIAAFLPMLLHKNYPSIFAENNDPSTLFEIISSPIFSILYNGHFAVLIFFVLSGYVLTIPYFKDSDELLIKKRLWGRYLRLNIPIAAAITLSYLVYRSGFYSNILASEISGSSNWLKNYFPYGVSLLTTVNEAAYGSIFLGEGTLVPPLWIFGNLFIGSIYLLLFYLSKPQKNTLLAFFAAFLFLYVIHRAASIYFMAIFLGSYLNSITFGKKWNCFLFLVGFYFGAFQFRCHIYDFLPSIQLLNIEIWDKKTFYNTVGAIFLTAAVINGFGKKIFESSFFQFLGDISFSFYLIHFIVLCSLSSTIYIRLPQTNVVILINLIAYIASCFFVSKIFQIYVDKPAINLSHKFSSYIFK